MTYEYTQDLSTAEWEIKIDPLAKYGYFENRADGTGGGLYFDLTGGSTIELIDCESDGNPLPQEIVTALRGAGYYLDSTYDPAPPPPTTLERRK